jgi:hypothetical protein
MNTYLFFNDKDMMGTSQGYSVNKAFLNLFGIPYDLKNSKSISYKILRRLEDGQ